MPTYRLDLEYNGAKYRGWQVQKNAVGVANLVDKACKAVFKEARSLYGAGRTDAGVHALHQVAHIDVTALRFPTKNLVMSLNDHLPPDIAVTWAGPAKDGFDARRDAVGRVYLYQILRRRSAFGEGQTWWVKDRLDLKAMRQAAEALQGRHDFAAFSDLDPEKPKTTVLDLDGIDIAEHGALLLLRFRGRFFLWKMVRRITGYLVEVGRGRYKPGLAAAMFNQDRKVLAPFTAPPQGLYLERVLYPGDPFKDALLPVTNLRR
jgi:tRNA pseudouridine38-40 synthase